LLPLPFLRRGGFSFCIGVRALAGVEAARAIDRLVTFGLKWNFGRRAAISARDGSSLRAVDAGATHAGDQATIWATLGFVFQAFGGKEFLFSGAE